MYKVEKILLILVLLVSITVVIYVSYELGRSQGHRESIIYHEEGIPHDEKSYIKSSY